MTKPPARSRAEAFEPHAGREMARMFDQVSTRYDLLNRVMTLGQDHAWRRAMWRSVPDGAVIVVDLCTGSGVSLAGLRRPGRRVIGIDVSLRMLEMAKDSQDHFGWAPRLVCGDAFQLPLRRNSVDAITIAFGMRNLRPPDEALAELARVLRPGGTLSVLEAVAPQSGPLAPAHQFYLRHLVPLAGRLSSAPEAYAYLSQSIFEFGAGGDFEHALGAAGFHLLERRRFLFGASCLWVGARYSGGEGSATQPGTMQNAGPAASIRGNSPGGFHRSETEWRIWTTAQIVLAAALSGALGYALLVFAKTKSRLGLEPWQQTSLWLLMVGGLVAFVARTVLLWLRLQSPPPRG